MSSRVRAPDVTPADYIPASSRQPLAATGHATATAAAAAVAVETPVPAWMAALPTEHVLRAGLLHASLEAIKVPSPTSQEGAAQVAAAQVVASSSHAVDPMHGDLNTDPYSWVPLCSPGVF